MLCNFSVYEAEHRTKLKAYEIMSRRIRAVLIDLSGTLFIGEQVIEKAAAAVQLLRKTGFLVKFVSNTTTIRRTKLLDKLNKFGFEAVESDVITSLSATSQYITQQKLKPMLLVTDEAKLEFDELNLPDGVQPDSVVVGLSIADLNYNRLTEAMNVILESKGRLIAPHKNKYHASKDGLKIGAGAFVSALEYSCGVKAEIIGKPSLQFFQTAVSSISKQLKMEECAMIGDDVLSDVNGAIDARIFGILVQTGKYRPGDETNIENHADAYVAPNIWDAVQFIIENNKASDFFQRLDESQADYLISPIEVERKFCISVSNNLKHESTFEIEQHLQCIGAVFQKEKVLEDIYYDAVNPKITIHDYWLRKRDGQWELKVPIHVNGQELDNARSVTAYREITDVMKIVETLVHTLSLPEDILDLVQPVATISTKRRTYTFHFASRVFSFDLDLANLKFGKETSIYAVGELETFSAGENDVMVCQALIDTILSRLGIPQNSNQVPGKLALTLYRHNRILFDTLISSGIYTQKYVEQMENC